MTVFSQFPIIDTCSAVLESYLSKAPSSSLLQTNPISNSIFNAKREPKISIAQYVDRFRKFADCSESCYISGLIYLDRLAQKTNYQLTIFNIHRLYLAAMVLAIKFNDDQYYDNEYYAALGGIDCTELSALETEMIQLLDFKLFVADDEHGKYLTSMERYYKHLMSDRKRSNDSENDNSADSKLTQDE